MLKCARCRSLHDVDDLRFGVVIESSHPQRATLDGYGVRRRGLPFDTRSREKCERKKKGKERRETCVITRVTIGYVRGNTIKSLPLIRHDISLPAGDSGGELFQDLNGSFAMGAPWLGEDIEAHMAKLPLGS
jgi:hypothetical protein